MMFRRQNLIFYLALAGSVVPSAAQNTAEELRPELGIYLQRGEFIRLEFIDFASGNQNTQDWRGYFGYFIEVALKPVLRRSLREQPDVYRNKYLTMRTGYRYDTGLTSGHFNSGSVGILELTSRYELPWQFVISDRNRGDFRFLKGEPFSTRYRNRLRLERDVKRRWLTCTPYLEDEVFYDTRYGQWTINRYGAGTQFPIGRHVVFDPYYLRQHSSRSTPSHLNIIGFRWNLYF